MSNLQIIEELCNINSAYAKLVRKMAVELEQHRAITFEEERLALDQRLSRFIGRDEAPDEAER